MFFLIQNSLQRRCQEQLRRRGPLASGPGGSGDLAPVGVETYSLWETQRLYPHNLAQIGGKVDCKPECANRWMME